MSNYLQTVKTMLKAIGLGEADIYRHDFDVYLEYSLILTAASAEKLESYRTIYAGANVIPITIRQRSRDRYPEISIFALQPDRFGWQRIISDMPIESENMDKIMEYINNFKTDLITIEKQYRKKLVNSL